jgi:hypothetical protein
MEGGTRSGAELDHGGRDTERSWTQRRSAGTSNSVHTARHTSRGSIPASRASSTVRLSSAAKTWSRAMDPARIAPNSSSMSRRKWVRRTRERIDRRPESDPPRTVGGVDVLLAGAPLDPTGFGATGQILALLGMLAALVVLLRWWFQNRR